MTSPARASTSPWRATACSSAARRAFIPRYRTPAAAIVAQSAWSAVLVLTGSFKQLIAYTGFAVVLFSGIAGVALFVLRGSEPDEPRPFRAWGYPWCRRCSSPPARSS